MQLSNLRAVDFFTNFWGPKLICHTFLSFDFGPDGYVCFSIETRMAKGQNYSALAGLYRQFELYYVIGINERARAADRDPAFSSRIREGLPGIREAWITSSLFQDLLARSLQAQDFSDQQRNVAQGAGADNDMRILAEKQHSEP